MPRVKKDEEAKGVKKHAGGRPTTYTPELGAKICDALATSSQTITSLCRDREDFPDVVTVRRWRVFHPEFRTIYDVAFEESLTNMGDGLLEDKSEIITYYDPVLGIEKPDSASIQLQKLMSDNKKWVLARRNRSKFGDQIVLEKENSELQKTVEQLQKQLELMREHEKSC